MFSWWLLLLASSLGGAPHLRDVLQLPPRPSDLAVLAQGLPHLERYEARGGHAESYGQDSVCVGRQVIAERLGPKPCKAGRGWGGVARGWGKARQGGVGQGRVG